MHRAATLRLTVQADRTALRPQVSRAHLRRWARCALADDADLTLRFVGPNEARRLNRAFRGGNHASNVLTFCYDGEPSDCTSADGSARRPRAAPDPRPGAIRADIVICMAVVLRQARAQRKAPRNHLAHMVIHGVLHAQHWDHATRAQARQMEALERRLLRSHRITDPY